MSILYDFVWSQPFSMAKISPAWLCSRVIKASAMAGAGVRMPPLPFTSFTRARAASAIIFDVEPYPGSLSPLTELIMRVPLGASPMNMTS